MGEVQESMGLPVMVWGTSVPGFLCLCVPLRTRGASAFPDKLFLAT